MCEVCSRFTRPKIDPPMIAHSCICSVAIYNPKPTRKCFLSLICVEMGPPEVKSFQPLVTMEVFDRLVGLEVILIEVSNEKFCILNFSCKISSVLQSLMLKKTLFRGFYIFLTRCKDFLPPYERWIRNLR